jgi:hypothetical protein
MPKAEKVKFQCPMNNKGISVGYGQMAALIKEAVKKHHASDSIANLSPAPA